MKTLVVLPMGAHPFHPGHLALYQSAQRAFPDAEVYVAATNDTSARPFPFPVKEKLAKLAGVETGHFVQVKSPFRAEEITARFDPQRDNLIFVRSEKDANKPPQAGGVKRDGSASYLQPLLGAKKLEPFARHAYMAYLPTVEFGPGMTSATQIRAAWPTLDQRRKTALVMSLYPKTQTNTKLAATVVKLLDAAIGSESEVAEGSVWSSADQKMKHYSKFPHTHTAVDDIKSSMSGKVMIPKGARLSELGNENYLNLDTGVQPYKIGDSHLLAVVQPSVGENQGWAATLETVSANGTVANTAGAGAGMTASYQAQYTNPVDYLEEKNTGRKN